MAYRHGVYVAENPTALFPPAHAEVTLPVVFGVAPVHKQPPTKGQPVNIPVLCHSLPVSVHNFNTDDGKEYTLCEFARLYAGVYQAAPFVLVNVFDPLRHKSTISDQTVQFDKNDIVSLGKYGLTELTLTSADGNTTYTPETDYRVTPHLGTVLRLPSGTIPAEAECRLSCTYADPGKVTKEDIIGGIIAETGARTGLELVSEIFPRFRLVPGNILAPGWSREPEIALLMAAKASNINGHFKAMAVADLPCSGEFEAYQKLPEYKNRKNLITKDLICSWPKAQGVSGPEWLSAHLCGVMAQQDSQNEDVPCDSPSNKRIIGTGCCLEDGKEVWLGPEEANYLNGQGIVTMLNFIGGWKAWGNRTSAYPAVTDVKDSIIPIRRMFNWVGNTLILSAWQKLDDNISKRFVDMVCDSFNLWLNGLTAAEKILGGRVEFRAEDNPISDIMDAVLRFRVYLTPASPGREFWFMLEYDPQYLQALFR